jgi:hypothetical protein
LNPKAASQRRTAFRHSTGRSIQKVAPHDRFAPHVF